MGTYTKSSINRTARPRSERLRELGGLIVPVSAAAASGGAAIVPTGTDHTHANLADLNRISITDGYIYITDEVIDPDTQETSIVTDKAMVGYADRAGANADGYTLDWFIPVTVNGVLTLKLNPIYAGLWAEGWVAAGGVGSGGGGGGSAVSVTQIVSSGTAIASITVDGVTTTLYAPASGTSVAWGTVSGNVVQLTVDGVTKSLLLSGALTDYATESWVTGQGYLTATDLSGYATQAWVGQQGYATQTWVGQQGYLTSSSLTGYATESWVANRGYITSSALTGYATESWVTNRGYATQTWVQQQGYLTSYTEQYQGTVTSVTLTSGTGITVSNSGAAITSSGSRAISISSTYQTYISHGETAYGWGDHSAAGYVHLAGAETISGIKTFTNSLYGKTSANNANPDWSIDNDGSASFDNLQVGGASVIPANYVTLSGAQTITGGKTFSGGIVMDGADIIPSADLGSQLGYSGRRFSNLNVRTIGSVKEINFKDSNNSAKTGYLSFQNGYMILCAGANIDSSYKQITFHESNGFYPEQSGVNLGYNGTNYRWANIYGVNADLSGNIDVAGVVSVNSLNTIDQSSASMSLFNFGARTTKTFNAYGLGLNLRAHDANGTQVNILAVNATKIQAGSDLIPNYTEGLNLGGSSANTRWATIYGVNADLSGNMSLGGNIVPATDDTGNIGTNDLRFNSAFIRNIYTTFFQFRDGTTKTPIGQIAFGSGYSQLSLLGNDAKDFMFYSDKFFASGGNADLGLSGHRWSNIYGVNADLTGDLALAQTSHIDIGPLRIEYDATNKALHITKKDSTDTETYGLYADGFVAAGGVGQTS